MTPGFHSYEWRVGPHRFEGDAVETAPGWHTFAFDRTTRDPAKGTGRAVMRGALDTIRGHVAKTQPSVLSFSGDTDAHVRLYRYLMHHTEAPEGYVPHENDSGSYAYVKDTTPARAMAEFQGFRAINPKAKLKLAADKEPEAPASTQDDFHGGWITPEGQWLPNKEPFGHMDTFRDNYSGVIRVPSALGWLHVSHYATGEIVASHPREQPNLAQLKTLKAVAKQHDWCHTIALEVGRGKEYTERKLKLAAILGFPENRNPHAGIHPVNRVPTTLRTELGPRAHALRQFVRGALGAAHPGALAVGMEGGGTNDQVYRTFHPQSAKKVINEAAAHWHKHFKNVPETDPMSHWEHGYDWATGRYTATVRDGRVHVTDRTG